MKYFLIYLLVINLITFLLFAIDKWKAVRKKWRIREATLMLFGFAGGTVGGLAAMYSIKESNPQCLRRLFSV